MTEETQRLIHSLKEKTASIQSALVALKEAHGILQKELIEKQVDFDESQVKLSDLKQKYNALKIAKSLQNGDDNESLKKQIDAMVREIDTCIELIDE